MASATYRVTGMTCGHCVRAVSAELTGLGGVTGVSVDLVPGGTSAVTVTSEAPWMGRPSRPRWTRPATTGSSAIERPAGAALPGGGERHGGVHPGPFGSNKSRTSGAHALAPLAAFR